MRNVCLISSIFFFSVVNIFSFTINNMGVELTTTGRQSRDSFIVHNDSEEPIGVVAKVLDRHHDIDGNEINDEVDIRNLFIIYPSQVVLLPGQEKSIRIQYVGTPEIDKEIAYRILFKEVPIEKNAKKTGISIKFAYKSSMYILPEKVKRENLTVERIEVTYNENKKKQLKLLINNSSNVHEVVSRKDFLFSWANVEKKFKSDEMDMTPTNILAMSDQYITLPWNNKWEDSLPRDIKIR